MTKKRNTTKKPAKRKPPTYPVGALFGMALVQLLRTRQALLWSVMLAVPVAFSLFVWLGPQTYSDSVTVGGGLFIIAYLHFIVPFGSLFLGSMIIRSEHEDGTLTYLVTRPVPRWLTVLMKYLAAALIGVVGVIISFSLSFVFVTARFGFAETAELPGMHCWPLWMLVGCGACVVYLALFLLVGMRFRRPIVIGLVFVVIWEGIIGIIAGVVRDLTIGYYFRSIAMHVARSGEVDLRWVPIKGIAPVTTALVVPAILLVTFLALSLLVFTRGEFHTNPDK